jgi:hypothetical protein
MTAWQVENAYANVRVAFRANSNDADAVMRGAANGDALDLVRLGRDLYRSGQRYEKRLAAIPLLKAKLKKAHDKYLQDLAAAGQTEVAKTMKKLYDKEKATLDPEAVFKDEPAELIKARADLNAAARYLTARGVIKSLYPF